MTGRVYPLKNNRNPAILIDTEAKLIAAFGSSFTLADTRPDIAEYSCGESPDYEGKTHFVLKAHGEVLTERAAEALLWAQELYRCTSTESISRNCTFLRFERENDAVIFKLFWL